MPTYDSLLQDLQRAITERQRAERMFVQRYGQERDDHEQELLTKIRQLAERREQSLAQLETDYAAAVQELEQQIQDQLDAVDLAHREAIRDLQSQHDTSLAEIDTQYVEGAWVASSVLDDDVEDSPKRIFEKFKAQLLKSRENQIDIWTALDDQFQDLATQTGYRGHPPPEPADPPRTREQAQARFQQAVDAASLQRKVVTSLWLPKLFVGFRGMVLFLLLMGLGFVPLFLLANPSIAGVTSGRFSAPWIGIAAAASAGASLIFVLLLYTLGSMKQSDAMSHLHALVSEAGWAHRHWLRFAKEELQTKTQEYEFHQREIVKQRKTAQQRFQQTYREMTQRIAQERETGIRQEDERYHQQRAKIEQQKIEKLETLENEFRNRRLAESQSFEKEHTNLQNQFSNYSATRNRERVQCWHKLQTKWQNDLEQFRSATAALNQAADKQFPDWANFQNGRWETPSEIPSSLVWGHYDIRLDSIEHGLPDDPRLQPEQTSFRLPALIPFPEKSSLLLKYQGTDARTAAIQAQQTMLLRLLTSLPPGKIRLTIIDPIGLGESFSGFMHLADYDEQLVTSRIWTETSSIEEQLADLTEHMENVLQKYLRNEFSTIEEYNQHAGEVAEPYRFLVISDFPAKFSEIAGRRLTSIVTSGPRCGVYTLMGIDTAQQLPQNFQLDALEEQMQLFEWSDGSFHAARGEISHWPIQLDPPPEPGLFTQIVKQVGELSKDARRVEVAFARVAPTEERIWSSETRHEINVPLGRAGATKLQHVRLGRGTSQHMLVAGKTGSGKSTFLHGLITNLALHYGPDEIRFFLIDFKKGVEFKPYASFHLPHADVIAIESDREFGVSALQRLDDILQERGELFRRHGVHDITAFRDANPRTPLPRILLIVDEFQEFFVEDDKLSQTASLLLDRLVRQGRAFGIHVVLGSQTLGGAYSLARSTLGQVAVRVALQCSEADAHLILSEENTAARLLSRPGEAIYNDANGLMEGNHPFQVAWLSDAQREDYLTRLQHLAQERGIPSTSPIVFEGNIPSDPARNAKLNQLIQSSGRTSQTNTETLPEANTIWLGEAVDIGPPASLTFQRHAGSHLLLVGTDADAAFGIMATSVAALAAQTRNKAEQPKGTPATTPSSDLEETDFELSDSVICRDASSNKSTPSNNMELPAFFLFDGSTPVHGESHRWNRLLGILPCGVRRVTPRDAQTAVSELMDELKRRENDRDTSPTPLFVVIDNISKFRDMRKGEDDYGFGGFGGETSAPAGLGQQFATLLSQGPEHGIHVLLWCDTASNVERWLSRNSLKELENRIVFQMNAADSSTLIDSPAASRLGVHRALFYQEETGQSVKFRPYGPPSEEWLSTIAAWFRGESPPEEATDLNAFTIT